MWEVEGFHVELFLFLKVLTAGVGREHDYL